ncbi:GNAT family N-acetyltransferase [Comamonas sp. lk]|uniref:GNAT family N-acetyltransferase n=1 Tax=Comamonas sp. lk TaxID=2201272 RepID=UPI000EB0EAC0|nr:GNAT family N-acetyltransferase [Comamonas sp. lk]
MEFDKPRLHRLPTVECEGLVLRAFEDSDARAMTAATYESLATVGRWMDWCQPGFSEATALAWFSMCRESLASGNAHEFGIFSAKGELLGGAGLNAINHEHRFCNLGYWVKQSAQRQGIALRTMQTLLPYAFQTLGMQRVEIVVATGNTASESVARKYGATRECMARNRLQLHGKAVAATVFSVVPDTGKIAG